MAHILVVDDEKNYRIVLGQLLEGAGYQVSCADNPFAALELLSRQQVSLIISDLKMPRMSGIDFLRNVNSEIGDVPFIIVTAFATVKTAIEALKIGAYDYLLKPFDNEEILLVVEKALSLSQLQNENQVLRHQLEQSRNREIVGESPAIKKLLSDIAQVAPTRSSVLICGESGTGKELVAQALHQHSPRSAKALVTVNCAAFAENLLESELFGHERGAFTGAVERKRGLLEISQGGTMFLDEIGELPVALQAKLLRVLQEKKFRRVGGTVEINSDVRIIAATNRNLEQMIVQGEFREDLYYRLNVVTLQVPALRERIEDVPLLAWLFLRRFAQELGRKIESISPEAQQALRCYQWPGNVRELQNVLERGVIFCNETILQLRHLPEPLQLQPSSSSDNAATALSFTLEKPLPQLLEDIEKQLIQQALVQARGIQAQAAEHLGISRSRLQYKLSKYGQV